MSVFDFEYDACSSFGEPGIVLTPGMVPAGISGVSIQVTNGLTAKLTNIPSGANAAIIQCGHQDGLFDWNYTVDGVTEPNSSTGYKAQRGEKILLHGRQLLGNFTIYNSGITPDRIWVQYLEDM